MMHLMADLETLGTSPQAVVLSVGVVAFDSTGIKADKEWHLDVDAQISQGRRIDWDTLKFWFKQNEKAKEIFNVNHRTSLTFFAGEFNQFCRMHGGPSPKPWGNGASFDIPIIESLLRKNQPADVKLPWKFWEHRCFRTIKAITNCDKLIPFEGERHGALVDARHQAKCLIELWKVKPELEA